MPTIDLRVPIEITIDGTDYKLTEGLNDVPAGVAKHWYVSKFTRPLPSVPRMPKPFVARPAVLAPVAIKAMGEALAPAAAPAATVPAAGAAAEPAAAAEKTK